jgi:peptide/nickel transport system substrate-binding protein
MRKCLVCFAILLFAIFLFSFEDKSTLRIGINTFPLSLNPIYVTDETSQGIVNKIFDSLFCFDGRGNIKKSLVEAYSILKNGTEIKIELKKGILFSDGKELDADDVVQTFKLLRNKEFKYPYKSAFNFIKRMKKVDRFVFTVFLNYKLANWRNLLTFKILNSKEIKAANPRTFKQQILSGTGPYRINTIKEPSNIFLSRNTFYKNKSLYQYLEYSVISSTHLEPLKLLKQEIDICELQPEDAAAFKRVSEWKDKFQVIKYKKFGFTYLVFNLKNRMLNKNVRRIFYNRLLAGNFLTRFLKQRGEKVKTPFLLLNQSERPAPLVTKPLPKGIKLKILTNSESKLRKEFVLFLKKELNAGNIILEPLFLEYHTFLKYIKKGNFDLAVSGFLLDIDYDLKDVLYSDAYFNYAKFKNTRMDQLLDSGLRELDPEKRKSIYMEANHIWRQELPVIPLFNLYYYMGISRSIRIPDKVCTLMSSAGDFLQNIADWKVQ